MSDREDQIATSKTITIDLPKIMQVAHIGVWRASAFLRIGLSHKSPEEIENFNLGTGMVHSFWPTPLPKEEKARAFDEYRHWRISACLKELDHFFSLFLDQCWWSIEVCSIAGTMVPSDYRFDQKFSEKTNVARKYEKVCLSLGIKPEIDQFTSLSNARNCLSHAAGVVRYRDCNETGALRISWIAPEAFLVDGDDEIVFREQPFDVYRVKAEEGAKVGLRFTPIERNFEIGKPIELSEHDLAEICLFYHSRAEIIVTGLSKMVEEHQQSQ